MNVEHRRLCSRLVLTGRACMHLKLCSCGSFTLIKEGIPIYTDLLVLSC